MKLTRRIRKKIHRRMKANYSKENILLYAFRNQVKRQLYNKIKKATTLEEVDRIIGSFDISPLAPVIGQLANSNYSRATKEFDSVLKALIDNPKSKYLNIRQAGLLQKRKDFLPFLNVFKHNVSLIKDLPRDLAGKLKTAYLRGTAFRGTAFAKELDERLGKRAKLIIRTESAKITSTLTQARMKKLGLNAIMWSSSADSRVRSSHAMLDGVLCFYDDPPVIDGYTALPGQTPNCRCVGIPIVNTDELVFPCPVAQSLHIQTFYVRATKNKKGYSDSRIVSGAIQVYSKEKFLDNFSSKLNQKL